jgi:hypothetical protein
VGNRNISMHGFLNAVLYFKEIDQLQVKYSIIVEIRILNN